LPSDWQRHILIGAGGALTNIARLKLPASPSARAYPSASLCAQGEQEWHLAFGDAGHGVHFKRSVRSASMSWGRQISAHYVMDVAITMAFTSVLSSQSVHPAGHLSPTKSGAIGAAWLHAKTVFFAKALGCDLHAFDVSCRNGKLTL
jgi:hypothetical protein